MRLRVLLFAVPLALVVLGAVYGQKPFRQFPGVEYEDFELPLDHQDKGEWTFARLRYGSLRGFPGFRGRYDSWSIDYPRSDRHLLQGVRRLTRIHAKSVEQVVDFDEDMYNWPFLYGVEVGHWSLSDEQAKHLRDYLLRGGFFMCDDFHGTFEWDVFMQSMSKVFPDRPVVELENKEQMFHMLYDLDDRYQVPGAQYLYSGQTWEKDGFEARWRGIYDDKGRLMVAICHNMDLGDAWEHSDNPRYPEKWASLAYRIGVNYVTYALTH